MLEESDLWIVTGWGVLGPHNWGMPDPDVLAAQAKVTIDEWSLGRVPWPGDWSQGR